jgi:hypothetical protein
MLLLATAAANPSRPSTLAITGAAGGQVFTIARETAGGIVDKIPGQVIADAGGSVLFNDFSYPLDEPWRYNVYDSTGAALPSTVEKMYPANPVPPAGNVDTALIEPALKGTNKGYGTITGIRWYRAVGQTSTSRAVTLWSMNGAKLGTGISSNETGSGWRSTPFITPAYIGPGTYIASYQSKDRYSYSSGVPFGSSANLQATQNLFGTQDVVPPFFPIIDAGLYMYVDVEFLPDLYSNTIGPVSSGGQPWISDNVFPETRYSPVWIVDIAPRTYPGRVTPYTVVGQKYRVTSGDMRSASDGSMTFLCFSHAARDQLINALSTGNPCSLRVPAACRAVVDEMTFTPVDIDETRFGRSGWCLLDVDFIEVDRSELPPFQAVTYATQKSNADAVALTYAGLSAAFLGWSYVDLYRSQTGIAP